MRSASNSAVRCTLKEVPEEQEQFMLRQYVKAIDHLQPHFSSRDKSSIRIALISCIIFICIEYFRGHFKTGQLHLMNGLKILDETYSTAQGWVQPHQLRDPIDEWIIRIFSRLHVQRELFNQTDQQLCKVLWAGANFLERMFCSINDAWQELEQLFSSIFMLAQQAHKFQVSGSTLIDYPLSLSKCQQQIQSDLSQWLDTYSRSQGNLQIEYPWEMARHLLSEYHSMATIMVSTALSNVESSYDSHTPDFLSILNHSIAMDKFSAANKREPTPLKLSRNVMDMSHSIVDIGWIPPLFYTALKCRVRRIRAHAIKLIESASHREGIWDSKIASRVARKVIEIEENCVKGPVIDENYGLDIEPQVEKCDKPIIPEEQRVRRTRVNLKDGLVDGVVLMYRKSLGDWEEVNVNLSND
jgi:hypothetical protein